MNVDWKARYNELAKTWLIELSDKVQAVEGLIRRIQWHMEESERLDRRERGVEHFLRLKEQVTVTFEDNDGCPVRQETYSAGSLLKAKMQTHPSIYLDDVGYAYFPVTSLEEVELKYEEIGWNKVINQ